MALYRTLFGKEVLVHARHIGRMITAHPSVFPTPPHQDFPLIQGSSNTWTCWFPVGDCPVEMGGLTVMRGSHHYGYLPIQPAKGAGESRFRYALTTEIGWKVTLRQGICLLFPAIHSTGLCAAGGKLRYAFLWMCDFSQLRNPSKPNLFYLIAI